MRVTPSSVWMGVPTMVLTSTISRIFCMVVDMSSLMGWFFSICYRPFCHI